MASNLPPGCSESDIPGCSKIDKEVDILVDAKDCIACKFFENTVFAKICPTCIKSDDRCNFRAVDDLAVVAERLKASAEAREDGHCDE